jgi:hypothetical protein
MVWMIKGKKIMCGFLEEGSMGMSRMNKFILYDKRINAESF